MRFVSLTLCGVLVGCGDSGGATTDAVSSTGVVTTTGATTGGADVSGDPVTTSGSTSTGETPTGSETGSSTGGGESSGDVATTGDVSSTGEETTGEETTGGVVDCDAVEAGPFEPALFVDGFTGSEDLAFDGKGGLALKREGTVVVVRADKSETVLALDVPPAYGTRYLADGRLLVALPQGGSVIAIDAGGASTDFLKGLKGPNGVYPDASGAVWITEFSGSRVVRVAADLTATTIVMGNDASAANGIVFDPQRGLAFYTNYQSGVVRRVAIDGQGNPGAPSVVGAIDGASPDGLTLDACGNLYVVDQGNSTLYRVLLDASGEALADPVALATLPSNVANAQFGVGQGFDDHTLYLAGNPGDVYSLALEFPGAPIVTVQ